MSFDPPVYFLEKRIPDRICNMIIDYGKSLQSQQGTVGDEEIEESTRKSNISWFENETWIAKWVIGGARGICNQLGWQVTTSEAIQFTIYNAPDGHYTWHKDTYNLAHKNMVESDDIYTRQRKVSVVCNITDPSEYEGGQLEIVDPTMGPDIEDRYIKIKKDRGLLTVFPSFLYHRVTPITKGTRYSLVCWLKGPEFK